MARARLDGFAFDATALVLARRLGLAVAEVPVGAQQRPGSAVRVLVAGRRALTQIWAIRWAAGRDHAAPPRSRAPSSRGSPWIAHESDLLRATPAQARGSAGTIPEMAHAIVNGLAGQAAAKQARARRQATSRRGHGRPQPDDPEREEGNAPGLVG
jgi:hypothetical protein